ncbi:MAG: TlyA family RNA methyltransferase [Planctomycetes bacterium]|nr:TlyA family RNA methyltransferase [Planctomycetota bacterium]
MPEPNSKSYVSRGGDKLAAALEEFKLDVGGMVCADLGSHVGGFVDCLLQRGAAKIYSVDTSYGTLAWTLRKDDRVVVLERTNAMHVTLPEPVDLVTIDVGWTPQARILPAAARLIKPEGRVVTLIKPHYEASKEMLLHGVLPDGQVAGVVESVKTAIARDGWSIEAEIESPLRGHGGNREFLMMLVRVGAGDKSR